MDATEIASVVPDNLKKLVKFVLRGFYSLEPTLIMDMLLTNACMKESDIMELLHFDKKQMGVAIKQLKNDQFIKTRMKVESDSEGKTTKHNYYFINYTSFVNVVKYKLDHVRRKLETQERDSTSRASFKCPLCERLYTDLEADRLFDINTGQFCCMICGSEMEEQQSSAPVKDARALMAKYNDQIQTLYELLMKCDKIKLSNTILEPAPVDISQLGKDRKTHATAGPSATNAGNAERGWSGDATRGIEFGLRAHSIDVRVGDDAIDSNVPVTKKEQPAWMTTSTVDGIVKPPDNDHRKTDAVIPKTVETTLPTNTNIMNTLLVHEKKTSQPLGGAASDASDESDMEEVAAPPDGDVGSDDEEEEMVAVGSRLVPFHEASELVHEMTDEQREAYNKLAAKIYADMYD